MTKKPTLTTGPDIGVQHVSSTKEGPQYSELALHILEGDDFSEEQKQVIRETLELGLTEGGKVTFLISLRVDMTVEDITSLKEEQESIVRERDKESHRRAGGIM